MKPIKSLRLKTAGLFCLLIILALLCFLRFQKEEQTQHTQQGFVAEVALDPIPTLTQNSVQNRIEIPEELPLPTPEQDDLYLSKGEAYNEYTWKLVSDLVYTYRHQMHDGLTEVESLLQTLQDENAELGALWRNIMETWDGVNFDLEISQDSVPDGLTQDDSLCIVVLGFQLQYNGEMAPELLERCKLGLKAANMYPHAFLALTGGGTAPGNRNATEAGVMADWFIKEGISPERIIQENTSLTTVQNAKNTCEILALQYPQVDEILMVTSDYHEALGILLFQEAAYLFEYEKGTLPYTVVANAAYTAPEKAEYLDINWQSSDLWSLADPHY